MKFVDRIHAGKLLAARLEKYRDQSVIVLGLTKGGVPIAYEIAQALHVPLQTLIVRKIGVPFQKELALGAICEDDSPYFDQRSMTKLGFEPDDLGPAIQDEREKIRHQQTEFRQNQSLPQLGGSIAIIVDDGLATGATLLAAIQYIKKRNPVEIVVAVPVSSQSAAQRIRSQVKTLVTLLELEDLYSVSDWYEDFPDVTEQQVKSIMDSLQKPRSGEPKPKNYAPLRSEP